MEVSGRRINFFRNLTHIPRKMRTIFFRNKILIAGLLINNILNR